MGGADNSSQEKRPRKSSSALASQLLKSQLTRKLSSTANNLLSDPASSLPKSYRLISTGEDSQLCFWRFDYKKPLSEDY
jgi:hypothetical protein